MVTNNQFLGLFQNQLNLSISNNSYLKGIKGSALSIFIQNFFIKQQKSIVVITNDKEKAAYLLNDLENLLPNNKVLFFPETYRTPYQIEKTTNANIQERTEVLNLISNENFNGIIISYPQAISEKVTFKQQLYKNTLQIKIGEKLSVDFLTEFLSTYNFTHVDFVYEPGQFAIRGGIIDVFSFANETPYRIELFGDEIESIKSFEPASQLSNSKFDFINIIPNFNNNQFNESKVNILEYFNLKNTTIFIEDTEYILDLFNKRFEKANEIFSNYTGEIAQLEPSKLFSNANDLKAFFENSNCIEYGIKNKLSQNNISFNQIEQPSFNKNFDLLIAHLKEYKAKGYQNYFLTDNTKQAQRFITIFNDLLAKEHRTYESIITYLPLNLHNGFIDHDEKISIY